MSLRVIRRLIRRLIRPCTGRLPRSAQRLRAGGSDSEAGAAIVEFCFLGVLLMVPLVYVILTVFRLQGAAYGVSSAAREAGRIYVTSDGEEAYDRAVRAAQIAMADHGHSLDAAQVDIACSRPAACRTPEATIRVTVHQQVPLPLIPELFRRVVPTTVRVSADHLEYVDRFRAGR